MKTIVRNDNNVSLYLFADDKVVDIQADKTVIGNPPELIIADCNTSNATLFEGVTDPGDWTGWKYLYTVEGGWVLNPDWVDPNAENA
jgi:hypothetical protein